MQYDLGSEHGMFHPSFQSFLWLLTSTVDMRIVRLDLDVVQDSVLNIPGLVLDKLLSAVL